MGAATGDECRDGRVSRFLPPAVCAVDDARRRPLILSAVIATLSVAVMALLIVGSVLFESTALPPDVRIAFFAVMGVEGTLAVAALLGLHLGWFGAARAALCAFTTISYLAVNVALGPDTGADVIGAAAAIAVPFLVWHRTEPLALGFTAAASVFAVAVVIAFNAFAQPLLPVSPMEMELNRMTAVAIAVLVGGFIAYTHWSAEAAKEALAAEKARSEELLLNILPAPIAERLKGGETVIADTASSVTVLFADIAGFTTYSSKRSAGEVVEMLNEIFVAFDDCARRSGVEKIKTMGDGYMAVAGLPVARRDHAQACVEMAQAMIAAVETIAARRGEDLAVRVGLHSGRVVAGVIGTHKFSYDLWGDTVNVASRMESTGERMRINVSADTRALLGDAYAFDARGPVPVKGKGEMETFFVDARRRVAE